MKVLVDFPTNNLNITKDKIVFDNSSIEDASYGKTEFSWTYSWDIGTLVPNNSNF